MTEGSGKGGERDRVSPLVDAVGIHADAAVASTSGETISGVEIPTMSAELLDAEAEDAVLAARTAVSYANDALFKCAADSIQIHGGIGFTWEHRCHEYFRRARADQQLLGHPRAHRAAIAHHLLGAI